MKGFVVFVAALAATVAIVLYTIQVIVEGTIRLLGY